MLVVGEDVSMHAAEGVVGLFMLLDWTWKCVYCRTGCGLSVAGGDIGLSAAGRDVGGGGRGEAEGYR